MARRFLAPRYKQRDYFDMPVKDMRDEPECLTAEEHARHIDQDSRRAAEQQAAYEQAQREKKWRLMTFDQQLADVQLEARAKRIDISSDIRLVRHMQRMGKKIHHLERRLGAIRRKVYR